MDKTAKDFFCNIQFKGNTLDEKSIAFLKEKAKSKLLDKELNSIGPIQSFTKKLSTNETIILFEHLKAFHFKSLKKDTKFQLLNFFSYLKWQNGEIFYALKLITLIEKKYKASDEINYVYSLLIKGGIEKQQGKFDEALKHYYSALDILNNQPGKDFSDKKILAHNHIAMVYSQQGEFDKALEIYYQNLASQKKVNDKRGVSMTCMNIGYAFIYKNDSKNAIKWSLKAKKIKLEIGDTVNIERLDVNLADAYLIHKDFKSAKKYIEKAKSAEDIATKNIADSYELKILIEELKNTDLNNDQRQLITTKAENSLKKLESFNNVKLVIKHYDTVIDAYKMINDYDKAFTVSAKKFKLYTEFIEHQKFESYKHLRANHEIQLQEKELEKKENLNRQLIKINEDLEQFTYMASHDLKTPLRNIIAFSNLINDPENKAEDLKKYSNLIISNAKNMNNLISSLLSYSKMGYNHINMEHVDLSEIIHLVEETLQEEIKSKPTKIKFKKLPTLFGNKILIIQLFQNLLGNAIKYNNNDLVEIEITGYEKNNSIVIDIKDNGIGIPADRIDVIFKAFSRAHSITKYSGTGIGLATCDKIMTIHSGEIKVSSIENEGSIFTLLFNKA